MLPIRIKLAESSTGRTLLWTARERMLAAQEHGSVPFERIAERIRPPLDRSLHPIFQAIFRMDESVQSVAVAGAELSAFEPEVGIIRYDLSLTTEVVGAEILCTFDYNADLFTPATIEQLATSYARLLDAFARDPEQPLAAIDLLKEREHGRLRTSTTVQPARAPRARPVAQGGSRVAPRNATEQVLFDIWRELLVVEQIGIHDDFFDLGGHSLLVMRMVGKIRARLQVGVQVRTVFDAPTIARLAERLADQPTAESPLPTIVPGPRPARVPLSFAQQRLWFVAQIDPDGAAYVVPYARRYHDLDVERLRRAFEALVARHEILRTTYPAVDGESYQDVRPPGRWDLPVSDGSALAPEAQLALLSRVDAERRRSFDLAAGPLLRTEARSRQRGRIRSVRDDAPHRHRRRFARRVLARSMGAVRRRRASGDADPVRGLRDLATEVDGG